MNNFRLVFHNPHTNIWYRRPLFFYLTKRKSVDKYSFFLDYCINNNIDFAFFADGSDFSFGRSIFKGAWLAKLELYLWCKVNKVSKPELINSYSKLTSNDVLFSFLYGNFTSILADTSSNKRKEKLVQNYSNCKALKVVHMTHYFLGAEQGAANTKNANIDFFVAESNLQHSDFFRHYYNWYKKDFLLLPFVPQPRFKNIKAFKERTNKAVATGTLMFELTDPTFNDFFKNGWLQPMRKKIFENAEELKPLLDSYIHKMDETEEKAEDNKLYKVFGKFYKIYFENFKKKQVKYFTSFNIVDLYNSYRMVIVPEEIVELPAVSFVECMAAGAAYIGKTSGLYEDIGMVNGVHYIGYDGTLEDLKKQVIYYQSNEDKLEQIAKAGCQFIEQQLNSKTVINSFFGELQRIVDAKNQNSN